ncbi:MAG TPA: hypothetical protein PLZ60_14375, partial [Kiritimatiellia bacterium]|nr:hypothetical protein [Kiritimatiellia bacterium]
MGGTQNIGYISSLDAYPEDSGHSGGGVKNGPFTVKAGTRLHGATVVNFFNQIDHYTFDKWLKTTVTGTSSVTYSGARVLTLKCTLGGTIASPSVGENTSIVALTRPTGDTTAATNVLTVMAGDGTPNTGTLTSRGYAAGVWVKWTWPSDVLTSGSQTAPGVATEKTISLSLRAGAGDATITANFSRAQNSASVWSPKLGNIVIHVLDGNLNETHLSTSYTATSASWALFLTIAKFTALSCSAGGKTRKWRSETQYDDTAYLLNVDAATFSVTPGTGMRVYGWKLQLADGTVTDFGTYNSAVISGFAEGCKIHLYLTSSTPNPRVIYDGFDATGTVPANQSVTATGTGFTAISATQWASNSAAPVSITLSPAAWATRGLGQSRFVIIDSGTPVPLANVAGTSASVTSSAAQFSLTHV